MPINITSTSPKIGIQTQSAKLNLSNNGAIDFKISHTNPQVQIQTSSSKLNIDQTKAFGDEGLKGVREFMEQYVQDGKQAVMNYISNMTEEGNRLSGIEHGGNPIAQMAKESTLKQVDIGMKAMPEHPPEIWVEPGEIKFDMIRGEINTQYNYVPIEANYIPSQIKYYMIQNGDLNIEYIGNNVDAKV